MTPEERIASHRLRRVWPKPKLVLPNWNAGFIAMAKCRRPQFHGLRHLCGRSIQHSPFRNIHGNRPSGAGLALMASCRVNHLRS